MGDIRDQSRKKQGTNQGKSEGLAKAMDDRSLIRLVEPDLVGPVVTELDSVFAVTFD